VSTTFDIPAIFDTLNRHGVRYLVIGGVAAQAYGHTRTTMDLDLMVAVEQRDRVALAQALAELAAAVRGPNRGKAIDVTDSQMLALGKVYQLATKYGDLDVFTGTVPGAAPFDELLDRATIVTLGSTDLPIVGLDDLIAMKRASGRPRDLADIDALTQL
jgi:predicted nucleotidyltransferase